LGNLELGVRTLVVVAVLVGIRAALWALGVEGMSPTALSAGIITGGVFVLGLVVAGTLSDYRDADRAPTDLAAGLYSILRESESMYAVWKAPDMAALRRRLIAVVTTLRADIDDGSSRTCQAAVEDLSESFLELDESDVPANYIVRLRAEQAGLRKSVLRVYRLQREEFLPSAYAMIVSFIALILVLLMFTNFDGLTESLVTVGFLSFFFLALLQLLSVISTPFKVGREPDRRRREPVPAARVRRAGAGVRGGRGRDRGHRDPRRAGRGATGRGRGAGDGRRRGRRAGHRPAHERSVTHELIELASTTGGCFGT
jgi:hypothetical protein